VAHEAPGTGESGYEPNFELSRRGVIREDNWPAYLANGFFVTLQVDAAEDLPEQLKWMQDIYGGEYVYTGDAWDYLEERPLRHKPGIGIYVDPEGLKNVAAYRAKRFPEERPDSSQP
jgi:hypothetical protein